VVCGALAERLSPEHQAVSSAVVYRELTVTRAPDELGLPRSTASSRLTAALELLGTWMEESLSESERWG
jgi:DNA-directed RNA polymerase specialized sigma24 family protein